MIFKYTFKTRDNKFPGFINLDHVAHIDFITREVPDEKSETGVRIEEGCVLTFPWQVQKQIPEPQYATPTKAQRLSGELPPISSWRNTIMWVNNTIIVEEPSEVEQLKAYYNKLYENVDSSVSMEK